MRTQNAVKLILCFVRTLRTSWSVRRKSWRLRLWWEQSWRKLFRLSPWSCAKKSRRYSPSFCLICPRYKMNRSSAPQKSFYSGWSVDTSCFTAYITGYVQWKKPLFLNSMSEFTFNPLAMKTSLGDWGRCDAAGKLKKHISKVNRLLWIIQNVQLCHGQKFEVILFNTVNALSVFFF